MFILIALILVLWAVCVTTADEDGTWTAFGTYRVRRLEAELHRLRSERRRAEEAAARTPSGWRAVGEAKAASRAAKRRAEREP